MNRLAGIIVAAIGLLVAVLDALKVLPGLTGTGVSLILGGALIIGLSFISKPETDGVPRMSTADTLTKIFYAPAEVFQNLRRHPRWLVALLIMSALTTIYTNAFLHRLTPERVVNYTIDKTKEMSFLNEQARAEIEKGRADSIEENKNPVRRAGQAVNSFISQIFGTAFWAVIFFLFALAMGGKLNFWQAFAAGRLRFVSRRRNSERVEFDNFTPQRRRPTFTRFSRQGTLVQDSLNFLVNSADSAGFIHSFKRL